MVTIKIDKKTLEGIQEEYKDFIQERNIGYIMFVIKTPTNIITAYDNKKGGTYKVTIQGENDTELAKKYSLTPALFPKKVKKNKESLFYIDVDQQIGSDEVGTGDFFGPIIVCASYVDLETMKIIKESLIKDSKKLTDQKIKEIIPTLLKKVHFQCLTVNNEKYNSLVDSGCNLNKIKALSHNHVLLRLHERCPYVKSVYVDQFTPEDKYYEYLNNLDFVERDIVFKEKGETYFPSVALASCIARYRFLQEMENLSKKYGMKFPLGAGIEVDDFAIEFVKKYGVQELKKVAKLNFKNYKKVLEALGISQEPTN